MPFNPNEHMSKLKGKDYLEVKWRLVWFRDEHPDWGILTNIHLFDERIAVVVATIVDATGSVKAMGTKSETPRDFGDYLEKAETGAIGRALAALGYGTQFAPELEEGERIVDGPVDRRPSGSQSPPISPPGPSKPSQPAGGGFNVPAWDGKTIPTDSQLYCLATEADVNLNAYLSEKVQKKVKDLSAEQRTQTAQWLQRKIEEKKAAAAQQN